MEQQDREVEQLANFICEKLRNSDSEEKIKELESLNFNLISEIAFELGYGISDMLRTPLLTREGMHAISKIGKRIRECRKEILKKKFQ